MPLGIWASEIGVKIQEITINSQVMNEQRDLVVFLPEGYGVGDRFFPVLYLTDGDIQGPHTAGSLDYLAKFDLTPSMIVVGIVNPRNTRVRDLTLATRDKQSAEQPDGADRLLMFVEEEVIPLIKKHYRTSSYQAISGTSHGGQFAINAMVKRPGLFNGAIAISPTLYWNERQLLSSSKVALKNQSLKGHLYLSIANEEPVMTESYKEFTDMVQQYPNGEFDVASQAFSQENHNSTTLLGQYYGLKHLFSDWAIPDTPQTLADLLAIYEKRSNLMGMPIVIPEDRANGFRQWLQFLNRQQDALALFKWNRENYSNSLNAHQALISAYLHFNLMDKANDAVEDALATLELDAEQKQELQELVL
jgi:predicted alpha/beta superfamily hydrolase